MYVSRLAFYTVPGKTGEVERALGRLRDLVEAAGGGRPRVLRTHYASLGAPDLVFEQEAADLAALEGQIGRVTEETDFQAWSQDVSAMLTQSPKREVYITLCRSPSQHPAPATAIVHRGARSLLSTFV